MSTPAKNNLVKDIHLATMTIKEAKSLFFCPSNDTFAKHILHSFNDDGTVSEFSAYNLIFNKVLCNGPTLPYSVMRKDSAGTPSGEGAAAASNAKSYDIGPTRAGCTFQWPPNDVENKEDADRMRDVFTTIDMQLRASAVFQMVRKHLNSEKTTQGGGKETLAAFNKHVASFIFKKIDKCDIDVKKGPKTSRTPVTNIWLIDVVLKENGSYRTIPFRGLYEFFESLKVNSNDLDTFDTLLTQDPGISLYADDTTFYPKQDSDAKESAYKVKNGILTPTEKNEPGKKKAEVHYITASFAVFGYSPRKSGEENMVKTGVKEEERKNPANQLNSRDTSITPDKFGIKAHLSVLNEKNEPVKIMVAGNYIDWFKMTEEVRNRGGDASAANIWGFLKENTSFAGKPFNADLYPVPHINYPPPVGQQNATTKKVYAGVVITGANVGYGAGSLKSHYIIPSGESLCVLPIPNLGKQAKSCLGSIGISMEHGPVIAKAENKGAVAGGEFCDESNPDEM